MSEFRYDVLVSGLLPARGAPLPNGERPHWSPLSHTLIRGPAEAALVDPPITVAQATALADWIAASGARLAYIYVTHWHADHWLTAGLLAERFPGVTVYATAATIARMAAGTPGGVPAGPWSALFPGQLPPVPVPILAEPAPPGGFLIDGHLALPVEAGHSDTGDTTVLHVPDLGLVVAGDVVYNNVHQYLAESADGGLEGWHRALDVVESLRPARVVAGHKDAARNDVPAAIDETRAYLDTAARLLAERPSRIEYFSRMLEKFPDRVNPYTVWLTAQRLLRDELRFS